MYAKKRTLFGGGTVLPKQDIFSLWRFDRRCRIVTLMKCKAKRLHGKMRTTGDLLLSGLCVFVTGCCQYCESPSDLGSSCKDFERPDSDLSLCGRLCICKGQLVFKTKHADSSAVVLSYSQIEGNFICHTTILLGAPHV